MRVLMLNGSPRGTKSVTGKLLDHLATGLTEGGASVTRFNVADMNISPCKACLTCIYSNPGACIQKDDMTQIYRWLKVSDLLVLGTPVYFDNMTAQMKAVLDRCVCAFRLKAGRLDGATYPDLWHMPARWLLVSTCGLPEKEIFAPLIATFRAQAASAGSKPLGEVCVPGSISLQVEPSKMSRHLQELHALGVHIATKGDTDHEMLKALNVPPLSLEDYLVLAAVYEAWCREKMGEDVPGPIRDL
jgi:putative NADPH-quinone reductase